jgi:hypothetical protein
MDDGVRHLIGTSINENRYSDLANPIRLSDGANDQPGKGSTGQLHGGQSISNTI